MLQAVIRVTLLCVSLPLASWAQWQQTSGPEGGPASFVTSNPGNGYLFAVVNRFPYRSTDAGVTWTAVHDNLQGNFTATILLSDGTDTYLCGYTISERFIYHSADYGQTWTRQAATGLPLFYTPFAMIQSGGNLLLGVTTDTLYRSTDQGQSWTPTSGIPSGAWIGAFARRGGYVYAGTSLLAFTRGIFRSSDDGLTWTQLTTPFITSISPLVCLVANANGLFAGTGLNGVHRTTDSGEVWTKINPGAATDFASAMATTASNLFICGPGGTIQRADADGNGWGPVNTGLPASEANQSIPFIAAGGGAVVAATNRVGMYRTVNAGAQWNEANSGIRCAQINGMLAENSQLFVASNSHGFFRSTDRGTAWAARNSGLLATNQGWWTFIRAGGDLLGGVGTGATANLMYRSSNDGATWNLSNTDYTMWETRVFLKAGGDTVYAGGLRDLFISTNNGASWTRIVASIGLGTTVLDIAKYGSHMAFAADGGGKISRSTDNGVTWTASVLGLPGGSGAFPALARIDTVMFVATAKDGVYRSYNNGLNWSKASTGVVDTPWCLLVRGPDLYVGTSAGVYVSTNRGTSWSDFGAGLMPHTKVRKLAADDQYFYAGTETFGVWRRPLSGAACPLAPGVTGDVNASGTIVSSDIVYLVNYVLKAGASPVPCEAVGDVNCDGEVKSSDIIYLVNFVLKGGAAPCDVCTLIPGTWSCP